MEIWIFDKHLRLYVRRSLRNPFTQAITQPLPKIFHNNSKFWHTRNTRAQIYVKQWHTRGGTIYLNIKIPAKIQDDFKKIIHINNETRKEDVGSQVLTGALEHRSTPTHMNHIKRIHQIETTQFTPNGTTIQAGNRKWSNLTSLRSMWAMQNHVQARQSHLFLAHHDYPKNRNHLLRECPKDANTQFPIYRR